MKRLLIIPAMLLSCNIFAQTMEIHFDGSKLSFPVSSIKEIGFIENDYLPSGEAVDLGLSVKWASCNLGAESPEKDGYYLSWGESSPKGSYELKTYSLYDYTWQEYTTSPEVLPKELDPATVLLGDGWRTPTKEEWQELLDNCTIEYVKYNNTTAGVKITGKNNNKIFMPYTGYYSQYGKATNSEYWSSTINEGYSAYILQVYGSGKDFRKYIGSEMRYNGLPVRPVYSE